MSLQRIKDILIELPTAFIETPPTQTNKQTTFLSVHNQHYVTVASTSRSTQRCGQAVGVEQVRGVTRPRLLTTHVKTQD